MNLIYLFLLCDAVLNVESQSKGRETEILSEKQKRQQARRERIQAKKALRKQQRQNSIKQKRAERKAAKEKKLRDKIGSETGSTTVVAPTTTSFGQNFVNGENFEWGFDIDDIETTMATTTVFVEPFTTVKSVPERSSTATTTSASTTSTTASRTTTTASPSTTTSTTTSTITSTTTISTTTVVVTSTEVSTTAETENNSELSNTTISSPDNILPEAFPDFLNDLSGLITAKSKLSTCFKRI